MTDLRSNWEWREWGRRDPYFAVAALPGRQKNGANPWDANTFRQMGAADLAEIERHWRHYGMGANRCVEIGCGAGRMTAQLVRHFTAVTAIDVSPEQIDAARRLLGADVDGVDFHIVSEPAIPVPPGSCDAMFSTHVFQHLSSAEAVRRYFDLTFAALASGGTICVHIPVPGSHRGAKKPAWWYVARRVKNRLRRMAGILMMEYHRYRTDDVFAMIEGAGFVDVELRIFTLHSTNDPHSFFFARKR